MALCLEDSFSVRRGVARDFFGHQFSWSSDDLGEWTRCTCLIIDWVEAGLYLLINLKDSLLSDSFRYSLSITRLVSWI